MENPLYVWKGCHEGKTVLSITYVCEADSKDVKLSNEHLDYQWIDLNKLKFRPIDTDFNIENWQNDLDKNSFIF